jgi:hypothetical protein
MTSRPRVRILGLVALPIIAVLLTAAVAFVTVERVRIGSPEFDRVLLYQGVIGDTVPAPATLSDPYLLAISMATNPDPDALDGQLALLAKAENGYRASIDKWTGEVAPVKGADAETVRATMAELAVPAQAFWTTVDAQFIPAVRSGDAATALTVVLGPLGDAVKTHHDIGDRLFGRLMTAQSNQEASTRSMIEGTRTVALTIVAVLVLLLGGLAFALTRRPRVRSAPAGTADEAEALVVPAERVLVGV